MNFRLYLWQRLSALLMAPLVLIHLAVIFYAMRGGLTAIEIVERFQSSLIWPLFYALFLLTVAVHAPIGLRNIMIEWWPGKGRLSDGLALGFALLILLLGGRMLIRLAA